MSKTEKFKSELLNIAIDDYKYFGRREETVGLIICGFGIYGNFELLKIFKGLNEVTGWLLLTSTVLLLIAVFMQFHCLILERNVRVEYMKLLSENYDQGEDPSKKSQELEDTCENWLRLAYGFMVASVSLSIIAVIVVML